MQQQLSIEMGVLQNGGCIADMHGRVSYRILGLGGGGGGTIWDSTYIIYAVCHLSEIMVL